jgi:hypothetical protein
MATHNVETLLSPKFFASFKASVEEIASRGTKARTEALSVKSKKELDALFDATRSYDRWIRVVIEANKGVEFPAEFALPEVRRKQLYHLRREPHRGKKKIGKRTRTKGEASAHLKVTVEKQKVSALSLGDYASCYPCCYENKPKGCRGKYSSDPDICFTNCIDGKLRQ